MTTALVILGVLAALFLAAALATRPDQALAPAPPDAADVVLPERVGADDVRGLRFGLAARGYRMSEVDAALERLAGELEERDRRLAELTDGAAVEGDPVDGVPAVGTPVVGDPRHDVLVDDVLLPSAADGPVEVDGIATAGLAGAGAGMDPLLPSVPGPDAVTARALDAEPGPGTAPALPPAVDPAALAAGAAGAAAVDVPAPVLGDVTSTRVVDGADPEPADRPARRS